MCISSLAFFSQIVFFSDSANENWNFFVSCRCSHLIKANRVNVFSLATNVYESKCFRVYFFRVWLNLNWFCANNLQFYDRLYYYNYSYSNWPLKKPTENIFSFSQWQLLNLYNRFCFVRPSGEYFFSRPMKKGKSCQNLVIYFTFIVLYYCWIKKLTSNQAYIEVTRVIFKSNIIFVLL